MFGYIRNFKVDDVGHTRHVDTARSDIGRNQQLDLALTERLQRGGALTLALVAMDRESVDPGTFQEAHDAVGPMFGAGEDQRAVDIFALEHQMEQRLLFRLVHEDRALAHTLCGGRLRRDADLDRIIEELGGERLDFLGHGGREEEILPFARQHLGDALQGMNETHVHHLVGFVEDEDFRVLDGEGALVDQIEQAAGRCDDDVDATGQHADLLVDRHAAEYGLDAQLEEAAIVAEALRDLRGQFAGRRQHQHTAALERRDLGVAGEIVEAGQRERRRLARAGLRDAAQILAFQQRRNGFLLDRRRGDVIFGGERLHDRLSQTKFVELHV